MPRKIAVKRLQGSDYAIAENEVIGHGCFATIVRAYNLRDPSEQLVSKIIALNDGETSATVKTELQLLKALPQHVNLVNYKRIQITSEKNLYLIMEYCNEGNLEKQLFACKYQFSEDKIWFFLRQFCEGYKVLYNNAILHRDIKPENILVHNGDYKIADFGLSRMVQDPEAIANLSTKGTPIYMAPELHNLREGSSKLDVFSLGIVLYRMAYEGKYPYYDKNRQYRSVSEYFAQLKLLRLAIPSNNRSDYLNQMIQAMLAKDPEQRIGWKQIFEHPRVMKAQRCERKREIRPLQQLERSLHFVNKSTTKVEIMSEIQTTEEQVPAAFTVIEHAFDKQQKSEFQMLIYRHKLTYTLIEETNKRIVDVLAKTMHDAHPYIQRFLTTIIRIGFSYCLFLFKRLEQISGDWEKLSSAEILNLEQIFENDKEIIKEEMLKYEGENKQGKLPHRHDKRVKEAYEDSLYGYLTEYADFPTQTKCQLRVVTAMLVDIYDLTVRYDEKRPSTDPKMNTDFVGLQEQGVDKYYLYLQEVAQIQQQGLMGKMAQKGLVFL